jgi:hypothetical protein
MAKFDIRDAYKLVPGHPDHWQLFGFKWLGKFFFDTTTVFGIKSAPASFDCLPETILNLVCQNTKIPRKWIHHQLDDVPVVSPSKTGFTERFAAEYCRVSKVLSVPLAELCERHKKAFGPATWGTVLGIWRP